MTALAGAGFLRAKQRALEAAIPLSAHIELTYHCDCRCVFCYNPKPGRVLAPSEWTQVFDDLRSLGTLTLTLTGGDPLAHPEFFQIAEAARQRAFALRVLTSGTRVDDEVAPRLAALRPLSVEMSLHGATAATHDATTRRPGSHAALWGAVNQLRALDVPIILKMILTRLNEDEMDAAITQAEGVPLRIDPMLTPCDDGDLRPLGYQASREAIERLMARLARDGRLPSASHESGGVNCGLGRLALCIAPDGDVFPCTQWRADGLGNVRDTRLATIWCDSPVRARMAEVARAADERLLEAGGPAARYPFCPALAQQLTGDPLTLDPEFLIRAEIAERARQQTAPTDRTPSE
jgi:mycofactocin biosynthetic radical S-adenosylmethionine protein MftC